MLKHEWLIIINSSRLPVHQFAYIEVFLAPCLQPPMRRHLRPHLWFRRRRRRRRSSNKRRRRRNPSRFRVRTVCRRDTAVLPPAADDDVAVVVVAVADVGLWTAVAERILEAKRSC